MDYNILKCYKVIPTTVSASEDHFLTQEQIAFYNEHGYLIIKRLFSQERIEKYKARFLELCNSSEKRGLVSIVKDKELFKKKTKPEDYINKRYNPQLQWYNPERIQEILYDDVYQTYSEDPRMLHAVSQLIGDQLTAINCMLINKPPGTPRHPPHQDLYYFPIRPADKIIGVWTAVDPVTIDNGCLFVIPGSHKAEVLYQHGDKLKNSLQFFHEILDEEAAAPMDKRVHLIMDPGDTVVFHPYLVHGSGPNNSKHYRKALTCHYANSHCHYVDVKGTPQELLASQIEAELRRRGTDMNFVDLWRVKCKTVRGVRANL